MKKPIVGAVIDERFLNHRLKSTSLAGIVGALLAIGLFMYRFYFNGLWSWDLLAVGSTFVAVKLAVMTYYFVTD